MSRRCKVSTECIIRTTEQRATGCLVLTSSLFPPQPLCSAPITRLTEYEEERIYLSILYAPGFVLLNFFLVKRDLMVKRHGWRNRSKFYKSFSFFYFSFLIVNYIRNDSVEGARGIRDKRSIRTRITASIMVHAGVERL